MKVEELKSELDRRMADRAKEGKVFDNSSSMSDEQVWSHLVMFIVPFVVKCKGWGRAQIKTSAFSTNAQSRFASDVLETLSWNFLCDTVSLFLFNSGTNK